MYCQAGTFDTIALIYTYGVGWGAPSTLANNADIKIDCSTYSFVDDAFFTMNGNKPNAGDIGYKMNVGGIFDAAWTLLIHDATGLKNQVPLNSSAQTYNSHFGIQYQQAVTNDLHFVTGTYTPQLKPAFGSLASRLIAAGVI